MARTVDEGYALRRSDETWVDVMAVMIGHGARWQEKERLTPEKRRRRKGVEEGTGGEGLLDHGFAFPFYAFTL